MKSDFWLRKFDLNPICADLTQKLWLDWKNCNPFRMKKGGRRRKGMVPKDFWKGRLHLATDLSSVKSALLAANLWNLAALSLIPINTYFRLWAYQLSADTVHTAVWSELNLCWLKLKKVTRVEKIAILFPWKGEGEERNQNGPQGFSKGCPHLAADLTLSSLKSALLAANLCNLAARSLIPIKTYLWLWANQLSAYRVSRNSRPKVGWFCFMATSDCEIHTTYEMSHFLGTFILLISIQDGPIEVS